MESELQLQYSHAYSIVNDVIFTALEPRIMGTTTFKDMLRMAKENFENTTSRFDNIQNWLNMSKPKDELVSTFMEKVMITAKWIKVSTVSEEEWIFHRFH